MEGLIETGEAQNYKTSDVSPDSERDGSGVGAGAEPPGDPCGAAGGRGGGLKRKKNSSLNQPVPEHCVTDNGISNCGSFQSSFVLGSLVVVVFFCSQKINSKQKIY